MNQPLLVLGNLRTMDPALPSAQAMVVRGDRLAFVGDRETAATVAGPDAQTRDFGAKAILPGFIDSHLHLLWYGTSLLRHADLLGSVDLDDLLTRMEAHARRYDGPWLQGRGWDQDRLTERRFPTRAELDRVTGGRPAVITRVCGHAVVANTAAIALLDPAERAAGDPETGLYTETAIYPFYRRVPPLSETEMETAVLRAADVALRTGVTSIGTLLDTSEQMGAYHRLHRAGRLPIRVTGMPPWTSVEALHANGIGTTFGDDWLRIGGAKLFSDGSLGARTALLAEPYSDQPSAGLGTRIYPAEDLAARTAAAQARGFQIVIHAIGDQAVRETLDAIEGALGEEDNTRHRHRIEHASLLPPDLMVRMARRDILAVVQPQFVLSDTWTGERVGERRAAWAYPFKSMRQAGIRLALSSDCPVERLDAFALLLAATERHAWSPDERLNVEEALDAYTNGSAYALHAENRVGSLTVGKLADFVVLDRDPVETPAGTLPERTVERVFVGGREARTLS